MSRRLWVIAAALALGVALVPPSLALFDSGPGVVATLPTIKDAAAALVSAENALSSAVGLPAPVPATDSNQPADSRNVPAVRDESAAIVKSASGETIDFSSRKLKNNLWGAPAGETLASSVYLNGGSFGWYWSRPQPKAESVVSLVKPIYPNVRIGGCPWEPSDSVYFPIQLGKVKSLRLDVQYQYPMVPSGRYDLAYDIFLMDTDKLGPNPKLKAEVMIWIHATSKQLPVTYKGDFSDGHNTYALYSWVMLDGRQYYSFVLQGEPRLQAHHVVDATRLLAALKLDSRWYIPGIELGNEVWDGSGKIEISRYAVELNGHEL